ncbi:Putative phosphotransferase KptA/Tpt1, RNA 2'-phosphotransferase domain-containing protein [Septoria linicola]|uniref:2'-phosphotransferase n=1 Tax=Septoria linicola TaxID=215465 RepID=A0A9Q9ADR6_9PEZI|nr:putative phosphotransferase KptA/Tpt1, RNA 2'-phosphotransferase domain-containing protein [Septoria linicola]USW47077.1 Putative phosphotransferase KptA/Tpt1, RNA 2'-phosphotransferase domain-containing protein [Septoria linicola]
MPERGSRRGGRGGGRGGPLPRNVQVSKKIAWLLRHGAEKEGLQLDSSGFINVEDVLQNRNVKSLKITFEELQACVQDNDKQRFAMVPVLQSDPSAAAEEQTQQTPLPSSNPRDYLIRANQGHSLRVESEALLQPITEENLPQNAIHGTTHAAYVGIIASGGLKPMGRNHVHLASGLPAGFQSIVEDDDKTSAEAPPVISGMRKSSTVLIFLDLRKAMDAGIKFWLSDNGVILSEGNEEGLLPLSLFKRVEDRTGAGVLVEDGKVVKEAPATWAAKGAGKR